MQDKVEQVDGADRDYVTRQKIEKTRDIHDLGEYTEKSECIE